MLVPKNQTEDQAKRKPVPEVKLVAEMPGDREMQEHLQEMKENDGYPGSCGI